MILAAEQSRALPPLGSLSWRLTLDVTTIERSMELVVQRLLLWTYLNARMHGLHTCKPEPRTS
jgi:hypothetical protein